MKESEAVNLLAKLRAAFPRTEVGERTIEVYVAALVDIPADLAAAAVDALVRSARYFPTIAEVRLKCAELTLAALTPHAAFEQASHTRPEAGRHPLVQRARQMVGDDFDWRESPRGVLRKSFLEAYAECVQAATQSFVERLALDAPTERKELDRANH